MLTEPTPEMLAALQAFADRNGRRWKETLSTLWSNGRDYYEPEGNALHAVRNELGPSWLYDRCRIKPAPRPKPAPLVHYAGRYGGRSPLCGSFGRKLGTGDAVTCPRCRRHPDIAG